MKSIFRNRFFALVILIPLSIAVFSQEVPHPISNTGVYNFLDELANDQIISLISAIKPYSRTFIAQCLTEADGKRDQMTRRQEEELDFYFRDFWKEGATVRRFDPSFATATEGEKFDGGMVRSGDSVIVRSLDRSIVEAFKKGNGEGNFFKRLHDAQRLDLFYYEDSLFSITVNPILGGEMFLNSSGKSTYWRNGAETRAYAAKWGFFASLRDNHEKPFLGLPVFLTPRQGGHIKGSTDWSEMQGGITYSWKWGSAGFVKDNIEWGTNYNGANILGGRNPSFIHLRLQLKPTKWFTFNYIHGWLNSMVVDSANSYWLTNSYGTDYREVYHKKFIAANMFTFTPMSYLNISAGNSIVYNNTSVNPAYLMPLFFYKSVDHSLTSDIDNMNSQMFVDVSSRQIKHLHLYATLFIDELAISRIPKDDEWNFLSWKAGFRLSNYPLTDVYFTTEYTYTYPLSFKHYVSTITFESNKYNLGHYLTDNSREWYISAGYRPFSNLDIQVYFSDAIRGPDYTELGVPRVGNPPLESVEWHNTSLGLRGSYQLIHDLYCWLSVSHSNISGDKRWSPGYFYGKKNTINAGVTFGF